MPRTNEHLIQYPGKLGHLRLQYTRRKAQAKFRKQQFDLSWEDFQELWKDHIDNIGKEGNNYCLTRKDKDQPWCKSNCIISTIKEVNKELGRNRVGMKYNTRKKNEQ